jgi:hypothetical protein
MVELGGGCLVFNVEVWFSENIFFITFILLFLAQKNKNLKGNLLLSPN